MGKDDNINMGDDCYDDYSEDSLQVYLRQIQLPILSSEEEKDLFLRFKNGDRKAYEILVERNLRLVVYVARRFLGNGVSFADLIQEGNIGLMKAVSRYDFSYNTKFSYYAYRCISTAISRAICNHGRNVRISVSMKEWIINYSRAFYQLQHQLFRDPTVSEIACYMNIEEDKVLEIQSSMTDTVSIFTLLNDEDDSELGDVIADSNVNLEDEVISYFVRSSLLDLFDKCNLTENEKNVLLLRYGFYDGITYTYQEIGDGMGVSRQAIFITEKRALNKIRNNELVKEFSVYMNDSNKCLDNIENYKKSVARRKRRYNN